MSERWMIQGWTNGELNALVKNLGEETARKIQRGEVKVSLEEVMKVLFDKHGRRIPEGLRANVCDPNRDFRFDQLELIGKAYYANGIKRLHDTLEVDTGISAKQLKREIEHLLAILRENSRVANIINGVWLPVIMPKLEADDLGTTLEQYLEAVGKSYTDVFPDRKFNNYLKGKLVDQVSIVDNSRHDQLIKRMRQGPVPGIHFPNPLQGFSFQADREQIVTLPERFVLSGLDTVIAMVMYPDILAWNYWTPDLDLAALSYQSTADSFYFEALYDVVVDEDELNFGDTANLAHAYNGFSGSLFFLG